LTHTSKECINEYAKMLELGLKNHST